jgi:hypothetical protein
LSLLAAVAAADATMLVAAALGVIAQLQDSL